MAEKIAGYQFEDIVVDIRNRQLSRNGKQISLNTKYFEVLQYLVEHSNQLVSRDELFQQIWSDVIVTDWALSQCIKDIRKALGDDARRPKYIRTFPKQGFMFIEKPVPLSVIDTSPDSSEAIQRRPYKFLDYYSEADTDLFYGRETEVTTLCSKILGHRSLIIYGRSGVGKSSIVHAGIKPALQKGGHQVALLRGYHDPVKELRQMLLQQPFLKRPFSNSENADQEIRDDRFGIFIFDQFEDFLVRGLPDIRKVFLKTLQDLFAAMGERLKLVFVIREDVLAEMDFIKEVVPEIFHHVFRLLKLNPDQALRAIIEPGRLVNCEMEEALTVAIIEDLKDSDTIEPPQLQIVCDALFDHRNADGYISLETYQELGGAARILSNYLDRVMHRFHGGQTEKVKRILKTLVSDDHQRLLLDKDILIEIISDRNNSAKRVDGILAELEHARVIRFHRENENIFIELTHDFLVEEIIKWFSEEEIIFNRTRAIFESAFQNYLSHQLLMDEDFLDLVLPMGKRVIRNHTEAEFFGRCLLTRRRSVPTWLLEMLNNSLDFLREFLQNDDENIRIAAVESTIPITHTDLRKILVRLALRDENLMVRKSAGVILFRKYGAETPQILNDSRLNQNAGIFRRAVSFALVKDQEKQLFKPQELSFFLALIALAGLGWVRLRRARLYILQQTVGGSLGAALSGIIVGFSLGITLVFYRELPAYESATLVLVLTSLGMITGFLVGMGISLGMTSMRVVSYRHHPAWSMVGAVIGGASIGGILHLLGVDTFLALFGQKLSNIAGAYEGALVGLGLSLGATIGSKFRKYPSWLSVLFAAVGSMLAAILLTFIEGNLFSASIESIARSFANSQMHFEALANIFGEANFGQISRLILGAFEGFLFGGFTILGIEVFARRKWGDVF